MAVHQEVGRLDPTQVAPAMVVGVTKADAIGHGRTLPLIGGRRNYVYDVVINGGRDRVYADVAEHVVAELIPGYGAIADALSAADQLGDANRVAELAAEAMVARRRHARGIRMDLQAEINSAAMADGTWNTLSEEEAFQCERSAAGDVPVGVEVESTITTPDGGLMAVTFGIWENPHVKLVIDRGSYGWCSAENIPEPVSEMVVAHDEQWGDVTGLSPSPENMIILDSSIDEERYLQSLHHAGAVEVTMFMADVEDASFLDAVRAGEAILEREGFDPDDWVGYDPENAVAPGEQTAAAADHDHDHDHGDHGHGGKGHQ